MPYELLKYRRFNGKMYERQGLATTKLGARKMAKDLGLKRFRVVPFKGMYGLYGK